MAFIKHLHTFISQTSPKLLLSKASLVAAVRVITRTSPFVCCRSLHTVVKGYELRPSQSSESDSDETDMDASDFSPKAWLKSGRTDPCVLKEGDEVIKAKADLPGIGRDDVKVWIENYSNIRFEATEKSNVAGKVKSEDEEELDEPRSYYGAIDVPEGPYKMDEVRAEMKNGVLEIVIPKLTLKERKDVRFISVV